MRWTSVIKGEIETISRPYFDTGEDPPGGKKKSSKGGKNTQSNGSTYFTDAKWDNINKDIGAFDVGHGAKQEILDYTSRMDPTINKFGYMKLTKFVSKTLFGAQALMSGYQVYNAWETNNPNLNGVIGKASLDITIGLISLYGGPVGWGVGAVYFIGDIYGWWGNWGEPTPIKPTKK
ncbi:MAG: hypothetical protein KatS3mg027_2487 [Bacteroidia bacterium]|nr:MAG: hypothetical protein KatS3mg027_2487 [Bacteroidia bacterium]